MRMTHHVYLRSGETVTKRFPTKAASDKAKYNGIYLAQTFGQIVKIEIIATNNCLRSETINFPQNYRQEEKSC